MPAQYPALLIVIFVSVVVLMIGKPVFTRFMTAEDFGRRRNIWLALTAASFLAPNIWVYVLIAAPLMYYGAQKDSNPVALYFLLVLAVPPTRIDLPTLGLIGQVFPLDHLRLLSLALVLPVAIRLSRARQAHQGGPVAARAGNAVIVVDALLLAYLGLQVVLMLPHESITSTLRRIVLLVIDVVLPYFMVSRCCRNHDMIREAMAAFVMATVVLAPLGVFEFFRGWMLFAGIQEQWGGGRMYYPLYRGDFLRAQTTAGHSINFGYFMAMALGMWLYLQGRVASRAWRLIGFLAIGTGLVVALARGPWVGAAAVVVVYLSLGPRAGSRLLKGLSALGGLFGLIAVTPWGAKIVDFLPFVGTVDANTIYERQQLAETSWYLIQQNPVFGSPYFLAYMEDLRSGEGIIDLVNTYATIALSFGLVGVGLFVGIFATLVWKSFAIIRYFSHVDPDSSLMGSALVACIAGSLVVIATTSYQLALPSVLWTIVALTAAYIQLAPRAEARFSHFSFTKAQH